MEKTLEDARWGGGGVQEGRRKRGKGTRTLPCSDAEVNGQREVGEGGSREAPSTSMEKGRPLNPR